MSRIITINSFKSSCPGGVESLIRNFHGLANSRDWAFLEFYKWESSKEIHKIDPEIKFLKYATGKGLIGKVLTRFSLYKSLSKVKPKNNVIFLFHMSDLLSIPISVLKNNKIIVVQTNRFDIFFTLLGKASILLYSSYINTFTVYTTKDESKLISMYPNMKGKIKVIPRGCRIEKSENTSQLNTNLVTITRLDEKQKNISEMINIINSLPKSYTLDIYGEGDEKELSLVKELANKSTKVNFCGPAKDIEQVLKKYSIFLMTSNYEGFGQTLIEARSQGLPIVLYNTFDAASYIVKESLNGFLVPKGDKKLFCEKVLEITASAKVYNSFSVNALNLASETDKHLVNDKWDAVLNETL